MRSFSIHVPFIPTTDVLVIYISSVLLTSYRFCFVVFFGHKKYLNMKGVLYGFGVCVAKTTLVYSMIIYNELF